MRENSKAAGSRRISACLLALLLSTAAASPQSRYSPDFPLAPNTRWTYHVHMEVGEAAHFNEPDARLAKGNSLDTSLISQVMGTDFIGALKYARVESTRNGRIYFTEWDRLGPEGLMVGRTIDHDEGETTVMTPPQKILSPTLKPGESWEWKAFRAPVSLHVSVVGPDKVTVPMGTFDAVRVLHVLTADSQIGTVIIRQTRWFVAGVGYVKQDTEARLGDHMLSRNVMTLEKFEAGTMPGGK